MTKDNYKLTSLHWSQAWTSLCFASQTGEESLSLCIEAGGKSKCLSPNTPEHPQKDFAAPLLRTTVLQQATGKTKEDDNTSNALLLQ